MGFTEYANLTLPKLTPKVVPTYLDRDPFFKLLRAAKKVTLTGGTKIRIRIAKGIHSEATEITDSNITVPLVSGNIFDYVEMDWPKIIIPLVYNHVDRDRMTDAAEVKQWTQQILKSSLSHSMKQFRRRLYMGDAVGAGRTAYRGFMTLFGDTSVTGTRTGFEFGLLSFATPAAQAASGDTWLTRSRRVDSTNDYDNWYTQYGQHNGIGVDFFDVALEQKILADSFAGEDEDGEMDIGLVGIQDHIKLGKEIRNTPGGSSNILYTPADITSGRVIPRVTQVDGIRYHSTRIFTPASIGITEPAYLLTSAQFQMLVNKGMDWKPTPLYDGLKTSNVDADIGFIETAIQIAPADESVPMRHGCIGQ